MSTVIKPFIGVGNYQLFSTTESLINQLKKDEIEFTIEVWNNDHCIPSVPWTIIRAANNASYFFAKNKLFKIYLENNSDFMLKNGIYVGMNMSEAKSIDKSLKYDDWNEDWNSSEGYWLEDDINSNKVISITIFIKEVLDEEDFEKYNW